MSARTPGRNDPCPCGSGRKYKHCCLAARTGEDALRVRVRTLEGRIVDTLFEFAVRTWGESLFRHAWEDFWNYDDVPEDITATPEFESMFVPWFVLGFMPDPGAEGRQSEWPDQPIGLAWLERDGAGATDPERDYIQTACRSPMSALVVEQAAPGRSLDLKDILTGRQFHVLEHGASERVQRGDVLFTRVVTWGGASVMFGAAPYAVPPSWHVSIIDWRQQHAPSRQMSRRALEDFEVEIRDLYFSISAELLNPTPPVLQNTDGDPFVATRLTYELAVPVHVAFEKLHPLAELAGESHVDQLEHNEDGIVVSAALNWVKKGNKQQKGWSNTILGRIELAEGRLAAEVNSEKRADRLAREIARRLGMGATLLERDAMDPGDLLASDAAEEGFENGTEEEAVPIEALQASPEAQAMLEEHVRIHWDHWLDTRIPALGGRTPRQAAKTAVGRERLEALLADFDRHAAREAPGAPDQRPHLGRVRAALGMARE